MAYGSYNPQRTFLTIFFLVSILEAANPEFFLRADPDLCATSIEYSGVPSVKIGDRFTATVFSAGGFVETRNEQRFNQGILPNHNWRGFCFANATLPIFSDSSTTIAISIGIEHESAHATMGIEEPTTHAFECIYDGQYRRYMLNAFDAALSHQRRVGAWSVTGWIEYQMYLFSKNTPELPGMALARSHGMCGGADCSRRINAKMHAYASVFARVILKSRKRDTGLIYHEDNDLVTATRTDYPIINDLSTATAKAGLAIDIAPIGRTLGFYGSFLYGNIFGYVDSRDIRRRFSVGIEVHH